MDINQLVFESLSGLSTPINTGGVSSNLSTNSSEKGNTGVKTTSVKPSNVKPKQTKPLEKPQMSTVNSNKPDFMKKNKPQYGLGSGKSLMGW